MSCSVGLLSGKKSEQSYDTNDSTHNDGIQFVRGEHERLLQMFESNLRFLQFHTKLYSLRHKNVFLDSLSSCR